MLTPEPPPQTHRRETLLHIILPVLGGGLLILIAVVIALVLQRRVQVQILADVLTTLLILCPLLICLFPLYLIFVVLAVGMGKIHGGTAPRLESLRNFTQSLRERVSRWMNAINKNLINVLAKLEPYLQKLDIFEKHSSRGKEHDQ